MEAFIDFSSQYLLPSDDMKKLGQCLNRERKMLME